jgi:hypothetical protein
LISSLLLLCFKRRQSIHKVIRKNQFTSTAKKGSNKLKQDQIEIRKKISIKNDEEKLKIEFVVESLMNWIPSQLSGQ